MSATPQVVPNTAQPRTTPSHRWDRGVPDKIGDYHVLGFLGTGGMGSVYAARQPVIGKRAAIKVLHAQVLRDRERVERFLGEARAVNEIRHRGVVDIFGFGTLPDGRHYLMMELLEGHSVEVELAERGALPVAEALTWTGQVLEVLDCAHSAGVVHRDLKPSNLFLVQGHRGQRYLKLLDFGIAKMMPMSGRATLETQGAMVLGTPDYMSPEQVRSEPVTGRTDLYSLGCVLYELLTGQRPFAGATDFDTMFMHVEQPPPRASDRIDGVPAEVEGFLAWLLEKNPDRRPPTAQVALEAVTELQQRYGAPPSMSASRLPQVRSSRAAAAPTRIESAQQLELQSRPTQILTGLRPRQVETGPVRRSLEDELFADLGAGDELGPPLLLEDLADEDDLAQAHDEVAKDWLKTRMQAAVQPAKKRSRWLVAALLLLALAAAASQSRWRNAAFDQVHRLYELLR